MRFLWKDSQPIAGRLEGKAFCEAHGAPTNGGTLPSYNAGWVWVERKRVPDLSRMMSEPDAIRKLLFHDPEGYMAKMLMGGPPDEERMLGVYQAMTVLARLVWERPSDPRLAARLHRVRLPALLLWGDDDRLVPPAYAEAYC